MTRKKKKKGRNDLLIIQFASMARTNLNFQI